MPHETLEFKTRNSLPTMISVDIHNAYHRSRDWILYYQENLLELLLGGTFELSPLYKDFFEGASNYARQLKKYQYNGHTDGALAKMVQSLEANHLTVGILYNAHSTLCIKYPAMPPLECTLRGVFPDIELKIPILLEMMSEDIARHVSYGMQLEI